MKTLVYDCEMFPITAVLWQLRIPGGYVPHSNVLSRKRLACVVAKYVGDDEVYTFAEWMPGGQEAMVKGIWKLLDECEAVAHYNGIQADQKWLQHEFLLCGLNQPSPYFTIDVFRAIRKLFSFESNSLAYVNHALGIRDKTDSGGMETTLAAMNGDQVARDKLLTYCENDVLAEEELLHRVESWLPNSMTPNIALIDATGTYSCPACGSNNIRRNGFSYTATGKYQRWICRECGKHSRSAKRLATTDLRAS